MKTQTILTPRAATTALLFLFGAPLLANHPVLLEGNCNNPPVGNSTAAAGVCGDFDGDGVIGIDEDMDGDRVFGTLAGANSSAGAGNNGTITIVTSGTFAESLTLAGNVTLQAAPGVEANIDAVLQGDPGSGARMGATGLTVNAGADRYVIVRNVSLRNWTTGISVGGSSNVLIQNCRIENNTSYGILAGGSSNVVVDGATVTATGRRVNPGTGDFPTNRMPMPGNGIEFANSARGAIVNSTVTGSVNVGVSIQSNPSGVRALDNGNVVFGNGRDWARNSN
jgi:parallel beta-helix repeat protein